MRTYLFSALSTLILGFLIFAPSFSSATPEENWQFFVDTGPGAFTIRPFHILQPARIDIIVEWFLETTELEVSLYNPGGNKPVRFTIQRPPVRWSLTTSDVHPWKGLWRLVIRNVDSTRPSRGRITVYLDYTYHPPSEETGEPEPNQPELYPPVEKPSESRPAEVTHAQFGLKTMDLSLNDDGSATLTLTASFPGAPSNPVQVESADDLFSFRQTGKWTPLGKGRYSARVSPVPAVLGNHCYRARLPLSPPPANWQLTLTGCFNIRCRLETVIEPSQPHPLQSQAGFPSPEHRACVAQPIPKKTARS